MPRNQPHSRFALATRFDARPWSGATLFKRDTISIEMPTLDAESGLFLDVVQFLNGYGCSHTLEATLRASWEASGGIAADLSLSLSEDDRIQITLVSEGDVFSVEAHADNEVFGFPVEGSGPHGPAPVTLTAPRSWRRGLLGRVSGATPRLRIRLAEAISAAITPVESAWVQDIRIGLRSQASGSDANPDAHLPCLEALDNDAVDDGGLTPYNRRFRWGVTDDGHVYYSGPTNLDPDFFAIEWQSNSFRERLGFSGRELAIEIDSGCSALVAEHPCPGLLVPTRPLVRQDRMHHEETSTLRLTNSSWASAAVAVHRGWSIEFLLDGPGDRVDLHRHWLEHVRPYCPVGGEITLFQDWGESRRGQTVRSLAPSQGEYGIDHTTELDGYRGRLLCRLSPDSGQKATLQWPGQFRRRAQVTLVLDDREE